MPIFKLKSGRTNEMDGDFSLAEHGGRRIRRWEPMDYCGVLGPNWL